MMNAIIEAACGIAAWVALCALACAVICAAIYLSQPEEGVESRCRCRKDV